MSSLTTPLRHNTRHPNQCKKARKQNREPNIGNKLPVFADNITVCEENSREPPKNLPELIGILARTQNTKMIYEYYI